MYKQHQGFSLIELAVIIAILAMLAGFAIPRFGPLDRKARVSAVTALSVSLQSAAALAHAEYLELGTKPASVTMDGRTIALTNGYPNAAGLPSAMRSLAGFAASSTASSITYTKTDAPTPVNCSVTYTASTKDGSPPTISTPVTFGC